MDLILALIADIAPPVADAGPLIPGWGWGTIVATLAGAVATLATLYKRARDAEVAAVQSKVDLAMRVGKSTEDLLERAIKAFTISESANDRLVDALQSAKDEISELRQEVRRLNEKER